MVDCAGNARDHNRFHLIKTSAAVRVVPAVGGPEGSGDRDLLTRVAHGDIAAFRMLYDQHAPRAMAIAVRILRSSEQAEDVVQETFLELWRRSGQFDVGRGSIVAWLVTIVRSRAIDRLRASATAGRALGEMATEGLIAKASPSLADQPEGRGDKARVARALAALPIEQRETIELAYFEGLSQSEIAVKTGSPLGTVKTRVKLAINKLAGFLKEEG
jgi:RNA polymerase sigma-70 factor (ECF subfamily)